MGIVSLSDGDLFYMLASMATANSSHTCVVLQTTEQIQCIDCLSQLLSNMDYPHVFTVIKEGRMFRVAEHMILFRGANRGSIIFGSSPQSKD